MLVKGAVSNVYSFHTIQCIDLGDRFECSKLFNQSVAVRPDVGSGCSVQKCEMESVKE